MRQALNTKSYLFNKMERKWNKEKWTSKSWDKGMEAPDIGGRKKKWTKKKQKKNKETKKPHND